MILRIAAAALLPLALAGCVAEGPAGGMATIGPPARGEAAERIPSGEAPVAPPAKTEKEPLRGLQSLTRVQLRLAGVSQTLQAEAVKKLRDEIPKLDTAGTSDDWTLEFDMSNMVTQEANPRMVGGPPVVAACRILVSRQVVVDGRFAAAVAYTGPLIVGELPVNLNGNWLSLSSQPQGVLRAAITAFAAAWHQANPSPERK